MGLCGITPVCVETRRETLHRAAPLTQSRVTANVTHVFPGTDLPSSAVQSTLRSRADIKVAPDSALSDLQEGREPAWCTWHQHSTGETPSAPQVVSAYPQTAQAAQPATVAARSAPGRSQRRSARATQATEAAAAVEAAIEAAEQEQEEEPRMRPWRAAASIATQQRIHRARTQTLYLVNREAVSDTHVNFQVLGSTGNLYTVTISNLTDCTCPDSARGNLCKHRLFVMLKVLRRRTSDPLVWQAALLDSELRRLFAAAPQPGSVGAALASASVRAAVMAATGAQDCIGGADPAPSAPAASGGGGGGGAEGEVSSAGIARKGVNEGDCCPICFEDMEPGTEDQLVWCKGACGQNLHVACMKQWTTAKRRAGAPVTCVYCRAAWLEDTPAAGTGSSSAGGYLNFADGTGQRRDRSSSGYAFAQWGRRQYVR